MPVTLNQERLTQDYLYYVLIMYRIKCGEITAADITRADLQALWNQQLAWQQVIEERSELTAAGSVR